MRNTTAGSCKALFLQLPTEQAVFTAAEQKFSSASLWKAHFAALLWIQSDQSHSVIVQIGKEIQKMVFAHLVCKGNVVIVFDYLNVKLMFCICWPAHKWFQAPAAAGNFRVASGCQDISAHGTDIKFCSLHIPSICTVRSQISCQYFLYVYAKYF